MRIASGPDGFAGEVYSEPTLRPQGHLAYWEATHPFKREDHLDPLMAFRLANRRALSGGMEVHGTAVPDTWKDL